MNVSRSININIASQIASKIISVVFGLATTLVLRRVLPIYGFGDYIFVVSFVTLFVSLADFGTHLVSVKELSQTDKNQKKVFGTIITFRLILVLFSILTAYLFIFIFFLKQPITVSLLSALPLIFFVGLKETFLVFFHANQKLYLASLQDFFTAFFLFIAALALAITRQGLSLYILLMSVAYFLGSVPFLVSAYSQRKISFNPNIKFMKILISRSAPLGLVLLVYTLYSKIDTFILRQVWGSSAVGVYGLSYKIYENLILPASYVMNAALPVLSRRLKINQKEKTFNLLQKISDILIIFSLVIFVLFYLTAPVIVSVFTGSTSGDEVYLLRILLFTIPFAYLNHLTGYTIIAVNRQFLSLKIALIALLFNILTNVIFIPVYSYKAAAVITVLTEALVFMLSLWVLVKQLKFFPKLTTWPATVISFIKLKGGIFDD